MYSQVNMGVHDQKCIACVDEKFQKISGGHWVSDLS